jgi:hypothetical protein
MSTLVALFADRFQAGFHIDAGSATVWSHASTDWPIGAILPCRASSASAWTERPRSGAQCVKNESGHVTDEDVHQ